ncbi:DUF4253 domain-containing protein [Actinomadura madurae]|nr:DUF4253 domain-containing protein [Actinomadura madurae]
MDRGADALAAVGWQGALNHNEWTAPLAAVLRGWEDRFGARVIGLGFNTLELSVAAPPVTTRHAVHVAAEHWAFCPDILFQGPGTLAATPRRSAARPTGHSGGTDTKAKRWSSHVNVQVSTGGTRRFRGYRGAGEHRVARPGRPPRVMRAGDPRRATAVRTGARRERGDDRRLGRCTDHGDAALLAGAGAGPLGGAGDPRHPRQAHRA